MGLVSLTAHVAGTILTAAALNNNDNAIINQVNGNLEAANIANLAITTAKINTSAVTYAKLDTQIVQGATTVTGAVTDYLAIADTSDSGNYKKALASDFVPVATQAEMEAATSVAAFVTPGRVNFHPGVAKCLGNFNGSGTPAFNTGGRYNFDATVTDGGTGIWTLTITTDFSTAVYFGFITAEEISGSNFNFGFITLSSMAAGTIGIKVINHVGTAVDPANVCVALFGDQ